jgi:hypothetical protein
MAVETRTAAGVNENADPNINVVVAGAGLDTYIPTIPDAKDADIIAKFKYKTLTKVKGKPTFESMKEITRQLGRNALAIKVSFGGGKRGCLGEVFPADKYLADTGEEWNVPASEGAYPNFDGDATEQEKKREISAFIIRETDIKIVEAVGNLLKAQLIESVEECYIRELHEGDFIEYDDRSLLDILQHINEKYAKMDAHILKANLKVFEEEPQMDNPIDDYFAKQEQCRRIAQSTKYEISDDDMVGMLVEHMGKTGTLTKSTVKFNKQLDEHKTWAKAKEWFRDALDDIMEMQKYSGADQELLANAAVSNKRDAVETARDDIASGMSESFDLLAQAAVAKSDTIDAHASTIVLLTKALAEATATITTLTETNAKLVAEMAKSPGNQTRRPPGLSNNNNNNNNSTGHTLNTQGVSCPTHHFVRNGGKPQKNLTFVTAQDCAKCGKKVFHLPVKCPEAPHNKALAAATKAAAEAIA